MLIVALRMGFWLEKVVVEITNVLCYSYKKTEKERVFSRQRGES